MELTVTITRNSDPTIVPSNWEVFEMQRDSRYNVAQSENSAGFRNFNAQVRRRLYRGLLKIKDWRN